MENRLFFVEHFPVPVAYEDGTPGTVVILQDMTADTKYREIQDIGRTHLEGIEEDLTELIIQFNPDGRLTYANNAVCRLFTRKYAGCIGRNFKSVILLEDHPSVTDTIQSLTAEHPVATVSCRVTDSASHIRFLEITFRAICDQQKIIREFRAVARDATEKHEAAGKIGRFIAGQGFLYQSSFVFSDLSPEADIYEAIGRGLREILPEAIIVINTLEPQTFEVTTRSFQGEHERKIFSQYLGKEIVGTVLSAPNEMEKYHVIQNILGGKLVKVPGDLFVMFLGQVPHDTCRKIEKALNIGDMYVIGMVSRNVIFGNVAIFMRNGDVLENHEFIEIYVKQATMALKCRLLEEGKKIPLPVPMKTTQNPVLIGFN